MSSASERRLQWSLLVVFLALLAQAAPPAQDVGFIQHARPLGTARDSRASPRAYIDEIFRGQRVKPNLGGSARSSNDFELADLVLVTTVADGAVHALRRATGQRIWTLHDTDAERARTILGPLVRSSTNAPSTSPRGDQLNSSALGEPLDLPEESYIVEPGTGSIFLHLRSSGRMQRLPMSVADLVDSSPFTFADDSSRMFVGKKTTQLVGVDLASGKVVGLFGPEAGWCEWKTQPGMTGASAECDDAIDQRPQDLLYMGRTEYQLSVYEKSRGELVQNLAYTTYHPSALSSPAPPWQGSPDDRYIQSLHNGELVCLRSSKMGWEWHSQELLSPVAEIFDVAVTGSETAQPVLFHHPIPQPSEELINSLNMPDLTYVGRTGNTLFAMSRRHYPFIGVQGAGFGAPPATEANDGLLGLHQVEGTVYEPARRRSPLAIDAPADEPPLLPSSPSENVPLLPSASSPLTLPAGRTSYDAFAWTIFTAIIACAIAAFFWSRRRYARKPFVGTKAQPEVPATASSDVSEDGHEAVTPPVDPLTAPVAVVTFDKALPPLPETLALAVAEGKGEVEGSDEESTDGEGKENAPKKKRTRRKRGKTKAHQRALAAASGSSNDPVNETAAVIVSDAVLETAAKEGEVQVGSLRVSDQVLGIGSHGTIVLRGEFQGRAVAVKRMLKQLITVASHEVALLQETDEHANVIRYFCKEQRDNFLYIALELCPRSLADLIERPTSCEPELVAALNAKQALRQITSGLTHLHRLKIVHRDIKPPNILVAQRRAPDGSLRMLISDFGLCKRLDGDASSFHQTVTYDAAGSVGWRAPEVLRGDVDPNEEGSSSGLVPSASASTLSANAALPRKRLTRAIDIFSLGCLAYYLLSKGEHPFGSRYERESNILKANYVLDKLDNLGDEAVEAQAMIESMIAANSADRPSADVLLQHPFFWSPSRRLHFICDASDRFETMEREPPDPVLVAVETEAASVVGADWLKALDRALIENLGKYRKYDGGSVRDLLRVIRNKKNHFQDLPENVKRSLGSPPEGFLGYFTHRFPRLFLHVWQVVRQELSDDQLFTSYFAVSEM